MKALELTAAKLLLDMQPSEPLPDVATELLERGIDSPSLRVLAGTSSRNVRDARDLFLKATGELGISVLDERRALWLVIEDLLKQVSSGAIGACDGARAIVPYAYSDASRRYSEDDLMVFHYLESEWGDHPPGLSASEQQVRQANIEADIRKAALDLLERGRLRRWIKFEARHRNPPVMDRRSGRPIALSDLPISRHLREDLTTWAQEFDHLSEYPAAGPSGFSTSDAAAAFVERGRHLARSLQDELGDHWKVVYSPNLRLS